MNVHPLVKEIDQFLAEFPLSEHRFGYLAAKNGRVVERLRGRGRMWPETEHRIREVMAKRREEERLRREKRQRKAEAHAA